MAGVVLAGGQSRRMGRPKALVEVGGLPMGRRASEVLAAAGAAPVVLLGATPEVVDALGLPVVDDTWPGLGPLAGLATGVAWAAGVGADLVVVTACDQPLLRVESIGSLIDALTPEGSGPGAVLRTVDERLHPFPSVWRTSTADALAAMVTGGRRRADAAMTLGVTEVATTGVDLADVDRPTDLAGLAGLDDAVSDHRDRPDP